MKVWKIYRYGHLVREINGPETAVLEWIRNNIPAQNRAGIRTGDVENQKYQLYEDARVAGVTINSKR